MPSFDIVSEVDRMEVKNAVDIALRELKNRFDFKGTNAKIELDPKTGSIQLSTDSGEKIPALRELIMGKLAARNIDLRNIDKKEAFLSPLGHSRQELAIKQGLDGDKAKEIVKAIKALGLKTQASLQDRQIRVSGGKRDDLQKVIAAMKNADFEIGLAFTNFRN
ncbi:MAG: YajQ family cyclic di-GMP-binding protein [Chthoniobacterales bacterium]